MSAPWGEPSAVPGEEGARKQELAVTAAGSTIWSLVSQGLQTLLGFGTTVLLTRWLKPEDYGVFGMASTVVVFVGILGDGGLSTALVRRPQLDDSAETTAFLMTLLGGLMFAAMALAAAPILGIYFKNRQVGVIAAALAMNFLLMAPGRVSFAKLTRVLRFRALSTIGIATTVVSSTVSLVAAISGFGAWSLALAALAGPLAVSCMYLLLSPPRLDVRLFSRALARELSAFGAHLSGFTIAVCIAWLPWTILLGRVADSSAVGLFGMGTRLVVLTTDKVGAAFSSVFVPSVARLPPEERRRAYVVTLRTLAMCTAPVAIGCIAVADEVVKVLPPRWAGLAPAMKGLGVGAVFGPLAMLSVALLTAEGKARTVMRLGLFTIPSIWTAAGLAALGGTLSAFVTAWSVVSVANAIVYLSISGGTVRGALQLLGSLVRPVLIAVVMGVGVEVAQRVTGTVGHRSGLPVGVVVGAVLYLGLARLVLKEDMQRTVRLLGSVLRRSRR